MTPDFTMAPCMHSVLTARQIRTARAAAAAALYCLPHRSPFLRVPQASHVPSGRVTCPASSARASPALFLPVAQQYPATAHGPSSNRRPETEPVWACHTLLPALLDSVRSALNILNALSLGLPTRPAPLAQSLSAHPPAHPRP